MYYRLFRAYNNHKIQQFDNMLTKQNVPITFDETNKWKFYNAVWEINFFSHSLIIPYYTINSDYGLRHQKSCRRLYTVIIIYLTANIKH